MKTLFTLILTLVFASIALAVEVKQVAVAPITSTGASASINVLGKLHKTVSISGTSDGTAFGNYSGTALVQCAPTTSGPWATCVQQDGTAITGTANYTLSWDDVSAYIRVYYTKSKHSLRAWINASE